MTSPLTAAEQDAAFRPDHTDPLDWNDLIEALNRSGLPVDLSGVESGLPGQPGPAGIAMDSRAVRTGDLYVGVPGANRHGAEFAAAVVAAGAAGLLTDREGAELAGDLPAGTPVLVVRNVRDAVGPAAAAIYRNAGVGPRMYGITGTNGKTTTSYFLTSLLEAWGETTGLIGTIEIRAGRRTVPSTLTTPESTQLHALMAMMRQEQVSSAAMEVSSHAISYRRVAGLHFAVAGFTNLTQDHLDLHGSMEEYFAAKAGLFDARRTGRAVITLDGGPDAPDRDGTTWGTRMAAAAGCPIATLSLGPAADHGGTPLTGADWTVSSLEAIGLGYRFTLLHAASGRSVTASTGLPGRFNVANAALAAVMVFESLPGTEWDAVARVLDVPVGQGPFATAVPGRMEVVGQSPDGIVDFAHNPDGMVRALESVRDARQASGNTTGRTILVFGATGDRDRAKRPVMGRIAAEWADVVIVTDDDAHTEEPAGIRSEVLTGVREAARQAAGTGRRVEIHEASPRQDAIELAVSLATPADTVLLAGRGHETVQDMDGVVVALDDRVELRAALARHGFGPSSDSHGRGRKVDGS
ncbi:UDP-N-acetylmuramoyl-L-alanyl-D-glutamate--2,6-diaminopimelate ligase [Citricoccus zhacaiensis]|uniref:UDP-N-acetylmuramyl-tripeptide synthetase n=1 Tax=Citricoccus zhacaiensis TaxID=489142 RepID=A0ABQ2M513_9MICC|nr:UDP-N-acetylmuramoyl-L-alanyl-D-glutamate--2,6-diaminopimelate ligase [Citricoccus zhacaiensis]GGO46959.1 UDP-N-acetylmuramoyl-L-alanyl-D-glutamate--2,6-diaminopimelate ligase [Citricoccus zhacaiensis]